MDTSIAWNKAWEMTRRLQDRDQVPVASVPPETWYMILEDIASQYDRVLERVQTLFVPVADLMTGHDRHLIQLQVPRGGTKFENGLSPATRVLPIHLTHSRSGKRLCEGNPGLWSKNLQEYLFLLAPVQSQPLIWAKWSVGYNLAFVDKGSCVTNYVRTVSSSRLYFLDKEAVLGIFRERPGLGYIFLDHIYLKLHHFEAELQKVAALRNVVEQMKYRIQL